MVLLPFLRWLPQALRDPLEQQLATPLGEAPGAWDCRPPQSARKAGLAGGRASRARKEAVQAGWGGSNLPRPEPSGEDSEVAAPWKRQRRPRP